MGVAADCRASNAFLHAASHISIQCHPQVIECVTRSPVNTTHGTNKRVSSLVKAVKAVSRRRLRPPLKYYSPLFDLVSNYKQLRLSQDRQVFFQASTPYHCIYSIKMGKLRKKGKPELLHTLPCNRSVAEYMRNSASR